MGEFASKGVAGTGLGLGIAGTALGLLAGSNNGNGGGLLGGLFGGNNNNGMLAAQGAYQAAISCKDAEIGQLKAERYADHVGTGVYAALAAANKEQNQELVVTRERLARNETQFQCLTEAFGNLRGNVSDLNREVADMRVREQRTSDAIDCLAKTTADRFESVYGTIKSSVGLEAERRECGDKRLWEYVNCNYVKAQKKISKDDICPEVMPRWNSWTAPTDTAPAVQPISGSVAVSRK